MPLEMPPLQGQDEFDDCPFDPTLRIPPLQYPIPFPTSRRPSPLEPSAQVNEQTLHPTTRLDVRTKASADTKLNTDDEVPRQLDGYGHGALEWPTLPTSFPDAARKRQKLEFFHLPKPSTRSNSTKRPSFGSVPVLLNELNEPPPSAALFPPIAINLADSASPYREAVLSAIPSIESTDQTAIAQQHHPPIPRKEKEGKQKRVYLRGRRPWTIEETDDLLKGVGIYGVGKWKSILNHEGFNFHPDRTSVDLKDRYRTCRLNEERAMDRHSSERGEKQATGRGSKTSSDAVPVKDDQSNAERQGIQRGQSQHGPDITARVTHEPDFNISTPKDYQGQPLGNGSSKSGMTGLSSEKKQHLPRWTAEEDANLSKGYRKYGFRWTAITKDPEIGLGHRSGPQVRDRFRLKFPTHYQAAIPIALPDPSKQERGPSLERDSRLNELKTRPLGSNRQELTLILRDSSEPPPREKTGQRRLPEILEKYGPRNLVDGNQGPISIREQDPFSAVAAPEPRYNDGEAASVPRSTPPASLTSEERSRQTSVEGEVYDTRNINIDDLLNSEGDQHGRLPPFKFPFGDNDWGNDTVADSVTLPPLLWDDMSSRPLFDLE